jgi:hypothetical protein
MLYRHKSLQHLRIWFSPYPFRQTSTVTIGIHHVRHPSPCSRENYCCEEYQGCHNWAGRFKIVRRSMSIHLYSQYFHISPRNSSDRSLDPKFPSKSFHRVGLYRAGGWFAGSGVPMVRSCRRHWSSNHLIQVHWPGWAKRTKLSPTT